MILSAPMLRYRHHSGQLLARPPARVLRAI